MLTVKQILRVARMERALGQGIFLGDGRHEVRPLPLRFREKEEPCYILEIGDDGEVEIGKAE